jgi:CheY-like chemotaxis protein
MLTDFKILFVHPDEKLAHIYRQKLPDFRVHLTHDGLSAVRMVRDIIPHLVLSDYNLPLLSGAGLLKFVRSNPATQAIPFIFLTNHEQTERGLALGANEWIDLKSASPDLIVGKIYYHLKLGKPIYV